MDTQPSFLGAFLVNLSLLAILLHAPLSAQYVERREQGMNPFAATFVIFLSSVFLIGVICYLRFRDHRPMLAHACLRQLVVASFVWMFFALRSAFG